MQSSTAPSLEAAAAPVEGRSPWQDARRRFMRNRAAVASLVRAGADRAGLHRRPVAAAERRSTPPTGTR